MGGCKMSYMNKYLLVGNESLFFFMIVSGFGNGGVIEFLGEIASKFD